MIQSARPVWPYDPAEVHGPGEYAWEVVPDPDWKPGAGWKCRAGAGPGHSACGEPSVARMNRWGREDGRGWWAYCEEHMHGMGRWFEDCIVVTWEPRRIGDPDQGGSESRK